tara:strand:+ start:58 stop:1104 length:1047 start_codon:yes stop_codon:yes gene_type:complete
MSIFDDLRQQYKSLYYPNAGERNFQTLRNNLSKDILTDQFNSAREQYQGLLSGRGLESRSIDATSPGEKQQFTFDPETGRTVITTPEYMSNFRTDNTDFFPGGGYQTGYDQGLGNIDPITGLPKDINADELMGVTQQPIPFRSASNRSPEDRNRFNNTSVETTTNYDPYGTFNSANPGTIASMGLGLLGAAIGLPTGLLSGISTAMARNTLNKTYGINEGDIKTINGFVEDGMSVEEAMNKFKETSKAHTIGRDFINTGQIDPGFGLVSDDKLRDITKKNESLFDEDLDGLISSKDKPENKMPKQTTPAKGTVTAPAGGATIKNTGKGGNPNKGEKNAGGGGFNAGGR